MPLDELDYARVADILMEAQGFLDQAHTFINEAIGRLYDDPELARYFKTLADQIGATMDLCRFPDDFTPPEGDRSAG